MKSISKLHFITTNATLAMQACMGGADWIQLRLKDVDYNEHKRIAMEVKQICKHYRSTFIINDNVQLAKEINADGVHIGKEDMDPHEARRLLGDEFIIGCTANTIEDVKRLACLPIDYIGLGPFKFTNTKQNLSPVLGLNGYRTIFEYLNDSKITSPPIIGIGGIVLDDVTELMTTGLSGIAVSGAISNAEDATEATAFLMNRTYKHI